MRRTTWAGSIVAVVAAVALATPQLAQSAPAGDPRAEREQVRAERAAVASQIDTSKASLSEVDAALQTLDANLRTQEAALARTKEEVAQARADIAEAEAAIAELTGQITTLRAEMRDRAVRAYVSPPAEDALRVLDTEDFTTASNRKFYIELRSLDDADIADRLEGATSDLDHQRAKATEAKERAEAKQAEQAERTDAVREAKAQKQQLSANLEATIDSQVARSIELAKTDRELSKKIAAEQAALVARLAAQKAAAEEAAARSAAEKAAAEKQAAADRAAAASVTPAGQESAPKASSGGGGGGGGGGGATITPGPVDAGIQLAYVQGVPVNAKVAAQVQAMINAAAADGVTLRIGNSYRSVSHQITLRRSNCGSSHYAIYEMPSGSCRPPTAKPGQSQHQLGLAIDFSTYSYGWLKANASRFGYYNLPGEAWHWSTTGS